MSSEELLEAKDKRIRDLEEECQRLSDQLFFLDRFSNDAQSIMFYTGFKDYATLKAVFLALQPTASRMIRWTHIQRHNGNDRIPVEHDVFRRESLALIDHFVHVLCRMKAGFYEQDLAARFNISQATVSRITITWVNYLYFMLGTLPLWPS